LKRSKTADKDVKEKPAKKVKKNKSEEKSKISKTTGLMLDN